MEGFAIGNWASCMLPGRPAHLTSPWRHELDLPCSAIAGAHSLRFPGTALMRRNEHDRSHLTDDLFNLLLAGSAAGSSPKPTLLGALDRSWHSNRTGTTPAASIPFLDTHHTSKQEAMDFGRIPQVSAILLVTNFLTRVNLLPIPKQGKQRAPVRFLCLKKVHGDLRL